MSITKNYDVFTRSPFEGCLSYLRFLAIINKTATNIYIKTFCVGLYLHSSYTNKYVRRGIAGPHGKYIFKFTRNCQLIV